MRENLQRARKRGTIIVLLRRRRGRTYVLSGAEGQAQPQTAGLSLRPPSPSSPLRDFAYLRARAENFAIFARRAFISRETLVLGALHAFAERHHTSLIKLIEEQPIALKARSTCSIRQASYIQIVDCKFLRKIGSTSYNSTNV